MPGRTTFAPVRSNNIAHCNLFHFICCSPVVKDNNWGDICMIVFELKFAGEHNDGRIRVGRLFNVSVRRAFRWSRGSLFEVGLF